MTIEIQNLQRTIPIHPSQVRRCLNAILQGEGKPGLSLSVAFVADRAMRVLNRRYHHQDSATDVLAFPLGDPIFGEIIVSTETAQREARKRNLSVTEELLRYSAHGLLHLLGYDDHAPKKKAQMWTVQEKYLGDSLHRKKPDSTIRSMATKQLPRRACPH